MSVDAYIECPKCQNPKADLHDDVDCTSVFCSKCGYNDLIEKNEYIKQVKDVTCVILEPTCDAMQQVIDSIWDDLHSGVREDPEHNTPFEFYKKLDTGEEVGFGIWPIADGYFLHMNCFKNSELMVVLNCEGLDDKVSVMYNAIYYYVRRHFGVDLGHDDFLGKDAWNEMKDHSLYNYLSKTAL